ncbi:hypothetical protein F0562_007636 [Nyssa sinensis]|uniref:Uncharacterized protein n=1 Tax=Nyssa sinensis TaxID=561372 RepID=A0A5J5A8V0_9ASTE|nr:hypothetical protein F0562_007636 [Nyssa sinensis]
MAVQRSLSTQKVAFSDLMCGNNVLSRVAERGGNIIGAKGEQPLGTRLNQERGMNNLAAFKSAFSDFGSRSKGLSPIAIGGSVGQVNTTDIGAESLANPMGKSWSQVANTSVQHKGHTFEAWSQDVERSAMFILSRKLDGGFLPTLLRRPGNIYLQSNIL